jgi:hypothetical protein
MNWKKGLGFGLIFVGVFICLTANAITGDVVGNSPRNYLGMFGVSVFLIGMILIALTRNLEKRIFPDTRKEFDESINLDSNLIYQSPGFIGDISSKNPHPEAHNAARFQDLKRDYERREKEIPAEEIQRFKDYVNRKVETGEWVELRTFTVRSAEDQEKYPQGTSLCRYWGPASYKRSSIRQLDNLYKRGKIGKIHEILRGSDKYQRGGALSKGNLSLPYAGAGVLHRHWEIKQMYENYLRAAEKAEKAAA